MIMPSPLPRLHPLLGNGCDRKKPSFYKLLGALIIPVTSYHGHVPKQPQKSSGACLIDNRQANVIDIYISGFTLYKRAALRDMELCSNQMHHY